MHLSPSERWVLSQLLDKPNQRPTELEALKKYSERTVRYALKSLREKKLIKRKRTFQDLRRAIYTLSSEIPMPLKV